MLGGNYEKVFANKENFDSEMTKRLVDKSSRKLDMVFDNKENVVPSQKRKLDKANDNTSQKKTI